MTDKKNVGGRPVNEALGELKFKASEYAIRFVMNKRTFMRKMTGEANPTWSPGIDPKYTILEVAERFDTTIGKIHRVMTGKDNVIKAKEAALICGIKYTTFHHRQYRAFIALPRLVRYLRSELTRDHVRKYL